LYLLLFDFKFFSKKILNFFLCIVFYFKGENGYLFDHQMKACFFNRKMNIIVLFLVFVFLVFPMIILLYFYGSIYSKIRDSIRLGLIGKLESDLIQDLKNEKSVGKPKNSMDDLKIGLKFSKGLVIMYIMYAFTIFPLTIIIMIDIEQKLSPYFHMYTALFFRLCATLVPIVYPLYHSSIRHGYQITIDKYILCKKKTLLANGKRKNVKKMKQKN